MKRPEGGADVGSIVNDRDGLGFGWQKRLLMRNLSMQRQDYPLSHWTRSQTQTFTCKRSDQMGPDAIRGKSESLDEAGVLTRKSLALSRPEMGPGY
jgi:hypothetical protein